MVNCGRHGNFYDDDMYGGACPHCQAMKKTQGAQGFTLGTFSTSQQESTGAVVSGEMKVDELLRLTREIHAAICGKKKKKSRK